MATDTLSLPVEQSEVARRTPRQLAGIRAVDRLLSALESLPEVLRPGCIRGEDDSLRYDYASAAALISDAIAKAPRDEFSAALGAFLVFAVSDLTPVKGEIWMLGEEGDEVFEHLSIPSGARPC